MKNKLFKSTIILVIGGLLTKIISLLIKIVITRNLTIEQVGVYSLIMPTFSLLISIASLGMPVAISKLVAEDKKNNKNLIFSIIPVSLLINLGIMLLVIISSKYISNNLLNEPRAYYAIICISFVLPFISISSILRGYFFGKEKMHIHVISNIFEDIVRLIIIVLFLKYALTKGLTYTICFIILTNIVSETSSILILLLFLPKNFKLKKSDFKINKLYIKETLDISLPTTGSRLIGNISYFLEPIIITNILLKVGYSNSFILTEYGILNSYILPLLLMPSFLTNSITQALIPIISKSYVRKEYIYIKKKIKQGIIYSLIIGIPATIIFLLIPSIPLKLIYNTNYGINYIKILSLPFLLLYIQSIINGCMQAIGKSLSSMNTTLISMIIKNILLIILSYHKIGLYSLVISIIFNIIFVTLLNTYKVYKFLK